MPAAQTRRQIVLEAFAMNHSGSAERFDRLLEIMDRLRDPGGCPWDAKQTMETLRPYLIEEAYECLTAMEEGDRVAQCEELGDLLLQVVFQSRIARDEGTFSIDQVVDGISDKLIRRHPHVFADATVDGSAGVEKQWEQIKMEEKAGQSAAKRSIVAGIPASAPALLRAARLGEKVSRVGLDWDTPSAVRGKLDEELGELAEALAGGDKQAIQHEMGDVLFTVAQWARHLGLEPEDTLRHATARFTARIETIEAGLESEGLSWPEAGDVEARWEAAKSHRRRAEAAGVRSPYNKD
jgi:MazG family protein